MHLFKRLFTRPEPTADAQPKQTPSLPRSNQPVSAILPQSDARQTHSVVPKAATADKIPITTVSSTATHQFNEKEICVKCGRSRKAAEGFGIACNPRIGQSAKAASSIGAAPKKDTPSASTADSSDTSTVGRAEIKKYLSDLQLKDDVPAEPKARALLAFLDMGESAVDVLLEPIRSSRDRYEQYAATEVLGFLVCQSALDPLLAMLADIKDHWLLCHWSRTLGCLADKRAAETLGRLCQSLNVVPFSPVPLYARMQSNAAANEMIKHDALGDAIARALGVVGDDSAIPVLVPMLGDDCFGIRDAAAETLVELGAAGIEVLLPIARDLERREELRRSPVRALGRSNDPRVVSVLIEIMQDKASRTLPDAAIGALRQLTASAAMESAVANALDSFDPQVRRDLAAALAEGNDNRGFDLLTNDVSAGNSPYACAGAARALGKLGDKRAFDTLAPLLNSNEKELRQAGAEALGHLGDPRAIPALASALKDREKRVRQAAALSLAYLKDARAFEPLLVALLPSGLAHDRLEVIDAFGSLGDERAVEPLVRCLRWASGPERQAICAALGRLGTPAIERLLVELNDARPLVRSKAAAALGNIGAASAHNQLTKLLDDSDTQVKSAAEGALRKLTVESSSSPSNASGQVQPTRVAAATRAAVAGDAPVFLAERPSSEEPSKQTPTPSAASSDHPTEATKEASVRERQLMLRDEMLALPVPPEGSSEHHAASACNDFAKYVALLYGGPAKAQDLFKRLQETVSDAKRLRILSEMYEHYLTGIRDPLNYFTADSIRTVVNEEHTHSFFSTVSIVRCGLQALVRSRIEGRVDLIRRMDANMREDYSVRALEVQAALLAAYFSSDPSDSDPLWFSNRDRPVALEYLMEWFKDCDVNASRAVIEAYCAECRVRGFEEYSEEKLSGKLRHWKMVEAKTLEELVGKGVR